MEICFLRNFVCLFVIAVSAVPASNFKKVNLMSLSKASVENNHNVSTNFFAATIENENETVVVFGDRVWKKHGFFNAIKPDFNMEKVNHPVNTLFYINQAYLTVKNNKKIFYCDDFILGQIIESSNPPENILSYTLKENEFRMIRPKYDRSTGQFKGLYETVRVLVVRGSPEEVFLNYGYDQNELKVLYSHYRRKILSSFHRHNI